MPFLTTTSAHRRPLFTPRKLVHMSMLAFALLLPILTWVQAAGCAVLGLLFNLFILPRLEADLGKRPSAAHGLDKADVALKARGTAAPSDVWAGIVLYPISVLLLILFYRHNLHIAAAAWAIMALGDGMASVGGEWLRGPALPWNRWKTWSGFAGFVVAGTVGAYVLTRWVAPSIPVDKVWMVSAAGAAVGALVESVPIRLDDNVSVPLVTGAFIFCAYLVERSALESNWAYLGRRLLLALVVNGCFALLALVLKMVNTSGVGAGLILGTAVYLGYGYKSFLILFAFFLVGSLATRAGYATKAARGVAERRRGARSWRKPWPTAWPELSSPCSLLLPTMRPHSSRR